MGPDPSDKLSRTTGSGPARVEDDADEMRARYAAIVESSDDAIVGKGLDGTVRSWNRGAERIVPASPFRKPMRPSARRASVLLVEDNRDAAEGTSMLLQLLGHRVRVAHDGVAAIDAARADPPDVILLDIGLPGADGYEVARRIRSVPDLRRVVLVALTGYGREQDRREALAAGFDHHLAKPVDPDVLGVLISRFREEAASADVQAKKAGSIP
jgi:two-component system CheB/CheR fusion protein